MAFYIVKFVGNYVQLKLSHKVPRMVTKTEKAHKVQDDEIEKRQEFCVWSIHVVKYTKCVDAFSANYTAISSFHHFDLIWRLAWARHFN